MAGALQQQSFKKWLTNKLNELNTDESVFGSYIVGILEGDEETLDEKKEALEGILSEIISDNLNELIAEILAKWHESNSEAMEKSKKAHAIDVDEQLTRLLEAQKIQTTIKAKQYTEEEKKLKDKILAQYSQTEVSDDEADIESDHEETGDKKTSSGASGIEKNTNVQDVLQLQKERREQARMDSAAKKQKDKEDREKQKQLREEKKEKRKTVKGERRR